MEKRITNFEDSNKNRTTKIKKPFYKMWWFWIIIIAIFFVFISNLGDGSSETETETNSDKATVLAQDNESIILMIDCSSMTPKAISDWARSSGIKCEFFKDFSDLVEKDGVISQSKEPGDFLKKGDTIEIIISKGKKPPVEYLNALYKAESYSKLFYKSKQGIYDQLTSEYGEGFSAEAAQYAIDNIQADWKANALESAKSYQENLHMSKQRIYKQLISEYGGKFTEEEAQYAIDNLED